MGCCIQLIGPRQELRAGTHYSNRNGWRFQLDKYWGNRLEYLGFFLGLYTFMIPLCFTYSLLFRVRHFG